MEFSKRFLGMESIKRQMDNLADMVNDLQLQMNKKSSEQKINEEQNVSEDEFSDTSPDSLPRNYLKRKKRLRWRSFYTAHQPSFRSRSIQLNALSVGQVVILRKLAILKMTALIERFR